MMTNTTENNVLENPDADVREVVVLEIRKHLDREIRRVVWKSEIGTGFTWQCGGIAQLKLVELLIWYTLVKSDVTSSIPGVSHIFRIVWIINPACLIKQPYGTLSRMYV